MSYSCITLHILPFPTAQRSSEHRGKTMDRKEKLLQELSVINKVIERKKQKKHGRTGISTNQHSHV